MKMVALIKRKAGLSRKEFREHYETSHVPLIIELIPFFTEYRRNYVDPDNRFQPDHVEASTAGPDIDVVTELVFASRADYEKMLETLKKPEVGTRIAADEELFIDRSAFALYMTDEVKSPNLLP